VTHVLSALPPPPCSSAPVNPMGQEIRALVTQWEPLPNGANNPMGQGLRCIPNGSMDIPNGSGVMTQRVRSYDPTGQGITRIFDPMGQNKTIEGQWRQFHLSRRQPLDRRLFQTVLGFRNSQNLPPEIKGHIVTSDKSAHPVGRESTNTNNSLTS